MDRRTFLKLAGIVLAVWPAGSGALAAKFGASPPGPVKGTGQKKWAMVVNPGACTEKPGCTDCIEACHRVHNVPSFGNPKDEVKWIRTVPFGRLFPEADYPFAPEKLRSLPVLALCNHCENPPCVRVCPTKATFRRAEDGIVMMDYHRCIGCRYCMAACPYGARSFNWRDPRPHVRAIGMAYPTRTMGVVEKCNFCEERLARGFPPACVEACKEKAMIFGDLKDGGSEIRKLLQARYSIRRRPDLGTEPQVYYLV